jgi:hypothetical protein
MRWTLPVAILGCLLVLSSVAASGQSVDPLLNGDFEDPALPRQVAETVDGSPADTCVGVGHQVFYGSDSPQGEVLGEPSDVNDADPTAAGEVDDPATSARQIAGVGHCVDSAERGQDVVWVAPEDASRSPAAWSTPGTASAVEWVYGADDDPFDREALIYASDRPVRENLWQSLASAQQTFRADADALVLEVETGQLSAGASLHVGLALSPTYTQHPFVGVFEEARLVLDVSAGSSSELVRLDPVRDGEIACPNAWQPCQEYRHAFATASPAERADLLGQARLVEVALAGFAQGPGSVAIDDVQVVGASPVAPN